MARGYTMAMGGIRSCDNTFLFSPVQRIKKLLPRDKCIIARPGSLFLSSYAISIYKRFHSSTVTSRPNISSTSRIIMRS